MTIYNMVSQSYDTIQYALVSKHLFKIDSMVYYVIRLRILSNYIIEIY